MDHSKNRPDFKRAALYWYGFGFQVIPIIPGKKKPPCQWSPWLDDLSTETIKAHWERHPDHELGFIVGDDYIVFDADSKMAIVSLYEIEDAFDLSPAMIVKTAKGEHHFFQRGSGTHAKSDSHSTEEHPERIDVKTGRALVVLPPSTGKEVDIQECENAAELTEATQALIDAVFRQNGREAPRLPAVKSLSPLPLPADMDQATARLAAMLQHIDPDCGYEDWLHTLMAVYQETGGSEVGFELADAWSRRGDKYHGEEEIRAKWNSFASHTGTPVTIGTLIKMLADRGIDWIDVCDAVEPQFVHCEYKVIHRNEQPPILPSRPDNLLDRYPLNDMLHQLEKEVEEKIFILMCLALRGQITIFYAAPNTGKTLLTLWLLIQAIKSGMVDPSKIYYINVDDSLSGLIEKLRLAVTYGFYMVAEGHNDFRANDLLDILTDLIDNDQCKGVVIILDTLKKFTDIMDKRKSTEFSKIIRRFIMQGGTCIALAHTNKQLGSDGTPVYAGTSDILEDADCAYTLQVISDTDAPERFVEFKNIKRRGNVSQRAAYCYSNAEELTYSDLFDSVKPFDDTELSTLKQAVELESDAEVIDAIAQCISEGIDTKMKLAVAAAKRSGVSKRATLRIINKYTGSDPEKHRWDFKVHKRGAKKYRLLDPITTGCDPVL